MASSACINSSSRARVCQKGLESREDPSTCTACLWNQLHPSPTQSEKSSSLLWLLYNSREADDRQAHRGAGEGGGNDFAP